MNLIFKLKYKYAINQQQTTIDAHAILKLLPATSREDWRKRSELSASRFKLAAAELNKRGKLWIFTDGSIEAAGKVATWTKLEILSNTN